LMENISQCRFRSLHGKSFSLGLQHFDDKNPESRCTGSPLVSSANHGASQQKWPTGSGSFSSLGIRLSTAMGRSVFLTSKGVLKSTSQRLTSIVNGQLLR